MVHDGECQRCGREFDWAADACPDCGWDRATWVAGGRYDLGRPGVGTWDD
ncbi:MAG: hypothetical protein ABEJ70_01115 [Halobacteriaceae archaeon]